MFAPALLAIAVLLLTGTGCTDRGLVTTPRTSQPRHTTSITPDGEMGDSEPRWPTGIHALTGDVILPAPGQEYPAEIIASGFMRYDSYHGRITGRANVTGPNSQAYDFYPQEQNTYERFHDVGMHAQWRMMIGGSCGNVVELNLLGEVWWMYAGGWVIDKNERTTRITERQAACPQEVPGGGVKEPVTGTNLTCYTYSVDHYWYYPDTGTYEYRYTTEETWCEPAQS